MYNLGEIWQTLEMEAIGMPNSFMPEGGECPREAEFEQIHHDLEHQKSEMELLRTHTANLYRALDTLCAKVEQLTETKKDDRT